eukprot:TRINITY_DN758_c0_g1_i5.p1 TRINITY_DN758_c0_g1~~TRINITY_DN758_c0_g1_i5.p1  ORF type:complete len:348 (+),score=43.94 TRINITY_DN758_c0_g1_i5:200-1243(+)
MEALQRITTQQVACLAGFLFVLYRACTLNNYPLLDEDPKPKESHKWRLITAAFYMPFVPGTAIFFPVLFKLFLTLMIYLGVDEFMQILFQLRPTRVDPSSRNALKVMTMTKNLQFAGVFVALSAFPGEMSIFVFILYCCFIFLISVFMKTFTKLEFNGDWFKGLSTLCIYVLCVVWVFGSLSHGILLVDLPHGGGYCTIVLFISWIGDAAAYYVGSKMGRHKVTEISPNKSWEGIVAEVMFALLLTNLFASLSLSGSFPWMDLPPISRFHYNVIGIFIGVLGIIGDMFESLVKRAGSAKDSGIFFPGHGGVLDRFDGFFFIVPTLFYYVVFVIEGGFVEKFVSWKTF